MEARAVVSETAPLSVGQPQNLAAAAGGNRVCIQANLPAGHCASGAQPVLQACRSSQSRMFHRLAAVSPSAMRLPQAAGAGKVTYALFGGCGRNTSLQHIDILDSRHWKQPARRPIQRGEGGLKHGRIRHKMRALWLQRQPTTPLQHFLFSLQHQVIPAWRLGSRPGGVVWGCVNGSQVRWVLPDQSQTTLQH